MKYGKKIKPGMHILLFSLALFFAVFAFPLACYATEEDAEEEPFVIESTGNSKFDAFISDPNYRDGAPWENNKGPLLTTGGIGCASYCVDFVKYCFGRQGLTGDDKYTDPSQIRAGDVLHLKSENSGHWIVVLRRRGNELYTAEGNWAERVRVGWNYMIYENDVIGSRHHFEFGSHFLPKQSKGGWEKDQIGWKYAYDTGGYAVCNWVQSGKKWYYLDADEYMAIDWREIDGKWYYFSESGVMQTGWKKIRGKWYFFGKNGAMVNRWKKIDGKWYFFKGGAMQTGWKKISGIWYFFSSSGAMHTGWKKYSGKWYYLTENGMVTGDLTIDGTNYTFSENGILIAE